MITATADRWPRDIFLMRVRPNPEVLDQTVGQVRPSYAMAAAANAWRASISMYFWSSRTKQMQHLLFRGRSPNTDTTRWSASPGRMRST